MLKDLESTSSAIQNSVVLTTEINLIILILTTTNMLWLWRVSERVARFISRLACCFAVVTTGTNHSSTVYIERYTHTQPAGLHMPFGCFFFEDDGDIKADQAVMLAVMAFYHL